MAADLLHACRDVSTFQSQESNIFVLLANASNKHLLHYNTICGNAGVDDDSSDGSCAVAIERGDFKKMFQQIRKALIPYALSRRGPSGSFPSAPAQRLPLCVLCAGIDMAMRVTSPEVLKRELNEVKEEVLYCLPRLLQITLTWKKKVDDDDTARLSAVGSVLSVVPHVATFFPGHIATFGESLLCGLQSGDNSVPVDIKVEAACTLVGLLGVKDDSEQHATVLKQIEANQGIIVKLLTTASMSYEEGDRAKSDGQLHKILGSLVLLGKSPSLRQALSTSRGAALAVSKHLKSDNDEARFIALELCKLFFETKEQDDTNLLEKNSALAAWALSGLLTEASDTPTLLGALSVTLAAVNSKSIDGAPRDELMRSMFQVAKNDANEEAVVVRAALSYVRSASRAESRIEVLGNIVGLLGSPYDEVRRETLLLLKDISYWNPRALLLDSLGCLHRLAQIVSSGTDDCSEALQICQQLAAENGATPILSMNKALVSAIVKLVTTEVILNRSAFINGVGLLLTLMQDEGNIEAFLPFAENLLPWLISLANTTTDDEMKQQLISVIIRFTVAKLSEFQIGYF